MSMFTVQYSTVQYSTVDSLIVTSCRTSKEKIATCFVSVGVRHVWSICAFDEMRNAFGQW